MKNFIHQYRSIVLAFSILCSVNALSQITGSNTTTISDDGIDPQNISTIITMPTGVLTSASDLTITLSANHTYVGDITATLTSPCGSTTLFTRPNAGAGNNGNDLATGGDYIFNSASAINFPTSSGGKVIYSTYVSSFSGFTFPCSDISGNWTLTLTTNLGDHARVLTLNNWSISVNEPEQNFFDSDGDGIFDNIDIDDDNDGILDSEEQTACANSSISTVTNYKFLNETFGTGNRTTINTTYDATTTYCYEDGTVGTNTGPCPNLSNISLNDGEYTVYYKAGNGDGTNQTPIEEVASWADAYWYTGEDHTTGDTNGRMAMFNASYDPGTFYTANIKGALPNVAITYSFWVLNLDTSTAPGIATRLRPDILVEFRDTNNNLLASITTGDIPPSINGDAASSWHNFTANLTFSVSEFNVYFINNEVGGAGNDLAIDDIVISQTLCDTDTDGVADVFDLDSDNDGIPDVVEAGLGDYSDGNAMLTGSGSWVDANANGMHDLAEGNITLDSDGDGTPNYLDLDSDNDTIFDVDESGAGNSADITYQNGDGDITGDGVGDGADTDAVRETDIDSDGTSEYYTDGILDLYDFYNGNTFNTAYGNANQGLGHTYYVKDTDSDGTPDYIDITSDGVTYDISHTLYADLDSDTNGLIDDTNDAEKDGIVDLFDTDDAVFGSPRDINKKLHLYFDGRNDYAEDISVINGWTDATLMAWIKIDPTASGVQIITGQNEFYLQLNADKSITAYADGNTLTNGSGLAANQWIHVATTYSDTSKKFKLYINGLEVSNADISSALNTDTSSFTIGRKPNTDSNYFKGYIDELRVFNKALSSDELKKMVYQEIENNTGITKGCTIPRDITNYIDTANIIPLSWSSLQRYFRMDTYKDDIIDDLTTASIDVSSGAKIYNTKLINTQSAPLPFITTQSGSLPTSVHNATNGINGNDVITYDWSIVKIAHNNVNYNGYQKHVGLIVNQQDAGSNPIEFRVENDSELNVSWYLKLDGKIDLEGESQLIQGDDSDLDVTSAGTLERDQQGTADTYTYNYWSAPVGASNITTNNNGYTLPEILKDGTNPANPNAINFLTSGYDGANSTPIGIADYWIWKFCNQLSDDYSSWQHVRSTGSLQAGEGFTMKGPGTGGIATPQNYVYNGKPNNGDINLTISAGNDYLVGNPYASAIDAEQFILDNGATINGAGTTTGTLYFWEHWGGGSHILAEYQGGYGTYNLSGGTPSASMGTNDPDVGTGGTPTKTPGRYIPVGQGFFVVAETSGNINFNNGQRVFQKEGGNSVFMKVAGGSKDKITVSNTQGSQDIQDFRMKFRIGFNSVNTIHRQLLLTIDDNATEGADWGYDGKLNDPQIDDIYWMINNEKYSIQGRDDINAESTLPIGIHTNNDGTNTFTIDGLESVPEHIQVYLHDIDLNIYHDLKSGDYQVYLPKGEYLNRFEITFDNNETLSTSENELTRLDTHFSNAIKSIIVVNPTSKQINSIELVNILGQTISENLSVPNTTYAEYEVSNISTGTYIIKLKTDNEILTKKVIVN